MLARTLLVCTALLPALGLGAPASSSSAAAAAAAASSAPSQPSQAPQILASDSVVSRTSGVQGRIDDYAYLRSDASEDETVIVITSAGDVWVSHDQGTNWDANTGITEALKVYPHPILRDVVYISTRDGKIYVSKDRGTSRFTQVNVPADPNSRLSRHVFEFHPNNPSLMLFNGEVCDENPGALECPSKSFYSTDSGVSWRPLLDATSVCIFAGPLQQPSPEELVYCQRDAQWSKPGELTYSTDWGTKWTSVFDRVYGIAADEPFLVAGVVSSQGETEAWVSANGINWAQALFPPRTSLDPQAGFTILSSETRSVFLFATSSNRDGREFGPLMKSNYNGTNFVTTLADVNRNHIGYVDFERVKSVEGVALANIVANSDEVFRNGAMKVIQTRITHSDGAFWDPIPAPETSSCDGSQNCWLHLHGFTERIDMRNGPSSPAAVGVIVAQGNVGVELKGMRDSSTFISRDAGISWSEVAKGPNLWEFGDSGSVIVLVDADDMTDSVKYTLNEGVTWSDFKFSDVPVRVHKLATIESDTSRKFILFAQPPASQGDKTLLIQLDFSGVTNRKCGSGDFESWTPQHPNIESNCLFGHVAEYQRKKIDRACYVGKATGYENGKPHKVLKNCECTELDYECDVGAVRGADGKCYRMDGSLKDDKAMQCAAGAVSWHKNTGYRRVPISTCENGLQLDDPQEYACPGKDDEFRQIPHPGVGSGGKGRSFLGTLFLVLFIIVVVVLLGIVAARFAGVFGDGSFNTSAISKAISNLFGGDSGGIHLGDSDGELPLGSKILHGTLDAVAVAAGAAASAWQFVSSRVFRRSPSDNMGYYARMDDEERYRILEFEDEDEADAHDDDIDLAESGHQTDHELIDDDELRQHV